MLESVITISIVGLLAGFIFAMPIAGPISILITSDALRGNLRFCYLVSLGAAVVDFGFVFVAVYGLTSLYSFYAPAIPYIFAAGSLFLLYQGYKIVRTRVGIGNLEDIQQMEGESNLIQKIEKKEKGGFYTGFMINFLNPTLFLGALTSSFFVISLTAALGFHTGGLASSLDKQINEISRIEGQPLDSQALSLERFEKFSLEKRKNSKPEPSQFPKNFHLAISLCYAFFLAAGSLIWFFLLARILTRFRHKINVKVISFIIRSLGVVLGLLGIFFGYKSIIELINHRQ